MILTVTDERDGRLHTDKGEFYFESLYFEDDIIMHAKTGIYHFIREVRRDEDGNITQILCDE